jgi:hypothetical protein
MELCEHGTVRQVIVGGGVSLLIRGEREIRNARRKSPVKMRKQGTAM